MTTAVIVNRLAVVHRVRNGSICLSANRAPDKVPVTPNQCLVYEFPRCSACWHPAEYDRFVGRLRGVGV